ncbi:twin-arginine translocase TatA/TatE family subunit [Actomonas aquatica]|uniref:Sec-independent protein translocase protein TatA n=1 Tax=Actomonas aquatica TaxID=2866162 RepID=A0ABZ1CED8_9BACT|nr:twin-arginine translocase TatA/TatE family subunit [Opitutus sp. WL0086]WRQ89853.1 twin-arginine translocase TatA/TatE family subunit [Opitutus sp. WL0086]
MVNSPSFLAFLDGIGGMEMLVIFALSLMLFGGKKLPEVARGLGKAMREFKRAASGVEDEIRRAIDLESPPPTSSRPNRPTAPPRQHPPITDPSATPQPQAAPQTVAHEPEPDLAEDAPSVPDEPTETTRKKPGAQNPPPPAE